MKYNPDVSTWLPAQIERFCTEEAIKYGEIYFEQLDKHLTRQAALFEGHPVSPMDFELFSTVQHQMTKNEPRVGKSIFFWRNHPILEVELSDYFYFKTLPLPKSNKITT